VHTWATGIGGCTLFGFQFFESRLYADVTGQVFFVVISIVGWNQWRHTKPGAPAQGAADHARLRTRAGVEGAGRIAHEQIRREDQVAGVRADPCFVTLRR